MQRKFLVLFVCGLLASANLEASVTAVKLYPNGATITAQQSVAAGTTVLRLPAQAQPDTLSLTPQNSNFSITDISWQKEQRAFEAEIKKLQDELSLRQQERGAAADRLSTTESRIKFWQQQLDRQWESAADALKIAEAAPQPMLASFQQRQKISAEIKELDQQLALLNQKLQELTGQHRQEWLVNVTLSGPTDTKTNLIWSYFSRGCGFVPSYRLNALPTEMQIRFEWEALVWQQTGQDWQSVDLTLASITPSHNLTPPPLQPWIIRPVEHYANKRAAMEDTVMMEIAPSAGMPERQVIETSRSSYTEWQLGRQNIKAGPGRKLPVQSQSWPAGFEHILRPESMDKAFIQASIALDSPRQVPGGQAIFMLDGTMIGQGRFELQGREAEIAFGADPLVRAKRELIEMQQGSKGLVMGKQTSHWRWLTTVTNGHTSPVSLVVEEARPQSRDERIKLSSQLEPNATLTRADSFVRKLKLAPGADVQLKLDVRLEAPGNLDIFSDR